MNTSLNDLEVMVHASFVSNTKSYWMTTSTQTLSRYQKNYLSFTDPESDRLHFPYAGSISHEAYLSSGALWVDELTWECKKDSMKKPKRYDTMSPTARSSSKHAWKSTKLKKSKRG